jgi:hypothetical protein
MLVLGLNFFALSSEYGKYLIDEYYVLAKILRMSYSDFMVIPTYKRKYLINRIIKDNTPEK